MVFLLSILLTLSTYKATILSPNPGSENRPTFGWNIMDNTGAPITFTLAHKAVIPHGERQAEENLGYYLSTQLLKQRRHSERCFPLSPHLAPVLLQRFCLREELGHKTERSQSLPKELTSSAKGMALKQKGYLKNSRGCGEPQLREDSQIQQVLWQERPGEKDNWEEPSLGKNKYQHRPPVMPSKWPQIYRVSFWSNLCPRHFWKQQCNHVIMSKV